MGQRPIPDTPAAPRSTGKKKAANGLLEDA